jgi:ribose transport system ATP-binding protein
MKTKDLWTASDIHKSFGASKALSGVQMRLHTGEIHALVGENGAGKSTLSKVAAGLFPIDKGQFEFKGEAFQPVSIAHAAKSGVSLVFQEQCTSLELTVAENIFIHDLRSFRVGPFLNGKKIESVAAEQLSNLGADFGVTTELVNLDLGQKKIIELARALAQNPELIFMDEVTAFLDANGRDLVINSIKKLKGQGITVCFVTHHLDEVFEIADRVTVMRDGKTVATLNVKDTNRAEIESLMVGREMASHMYPQRTIKNLERENLLEVKDLKVRDKIVGANFSVAPGEILGIAGLAGCGGSSFLKCIVGDLQTKSGHMIFSSKSYSPKNPREARDMGIAYLPGERDIEGLLSVFSVRENICLPILPRSFSKVSGAKEKQVSQDFVEKLEIKTQSIESIVDSLSGGNRQKVVLSKLLAISPKVLLLDNPTRGVDVGAREHIYSAIAAVAQSGTAVILYSEELNELLGLCDRLLVLRRGAISKEFQDVAHLSENDVISFML